MYVMRRDALAEKRPMLRSDGHCRETFQPLISATNQGLGGLGVLADNSDELPFVQGSPFSRSASGFASPTSGDRSCERFL
jgi:hypothetical protein